MQTIYCISGLGADQQLFERLQLPEGVVLKHLPWIKPDDDEDIPAYAGRMAAGIEENHPVLMGVSFGGMISVEIAKLREVKQIIMISSIKTTDERPFYFKAVAALRLNRVVPLKPYSFLEPFENYSLGVKTAEERELARKYRQNYDAKYVNWAIERIVNWKNRWLPPHIFHIHGTDDHVFPIRYIRADRKVVGGGHMMVWNKPQEISKLIKEGLEEGGVI